MIIHVAWKLYKKAAEVMKQIETDVGYRGGEKKQKISFRILPVQFIKH